MPPYRYKHDPPPTLLAALELQTVDTLRTYLGLLQGKKRSTGRKAELVAELWRELRGERLRAAWEKLDDIGRAALAEAARDSDGAFREDRFEARYGELPAWNSRLGDTSRYSGGAPTLITVFFHAGRLPTDLRDELRGFVPEPDEPRLPVVESLPRRYVDPDDDAEEPGAALEVREMELSARHDLRAVLGLIEAGKLLVSETTRLPGAAACKAVSAVLSGGDFHENETPGFEGDHTFHDPVGPIRAYAWPLLVQAAGLTSADGKRLQLSKTGRKALADPPEKTLRTLWRRWRKTTLFDEFRRIDDIKGQTGKGKRGFTAVAGRREAIESALQQCPTGTWIDVDELFRFMRASDRNFEVTRDPWALYFGDSHYGSLGHSGYHDWSILQGRYALCLLLEYAATLGIVDVACTPPHGARDDYADLWGTDDFSFLSRYDGLRYLRLTPLGAYCLGLTESYIPIEPEHRECVRISPDFEIVAIGAGPDPAEQLLLDGYSERREAGRWYLTLERLLAATEKGLNIDELRGFLVARGNGELPEPVELLLRGATERATLLKDEGAARLIECADETLAARIAGDARCAKLCRAAGELHLVVRADDLDRFRKAVRKLGYSLPVRC